MFRVNHQNRLTFINDAFTKQFDMASGKLLGSDITTLVAPKDIPALEHSLDVVRTDGTPNSETCTCHVGAHGQRTTATIELHPAGDQSSSGDILGAVRKDISAHQPETAAFHRDRFNNLFNLIDDAVVEVQIRDSEPIVQAVNPGFEELFGYDAEDIRGNSLNEYIVPDSQTDEALSFDKRTADGKMNQDIVTRRTTDGLREFLYRGIPYNWDDSRQSGLAVYADITNQKRTRQHLKVLHRVLRHNLRNALVVMLGQADEIRKQAASPEIERAATQIVNRAETLETVSKKAQDAENILGDPSPSIVDIAEVARDVVSEAANRWPAATIETDLDDSLSVAVSGKIQDAIYNLVENAIVHTESQPTVRVEASTHTSGSSLTHTSPNDETVAVRVADDGPGIPAHERAVVFGEDDLTQLSHGSGLGLWIVRWVTESADGRVVYDRSDGWTIIELRFPQPATNDVTPLAD